MNLRLPLFVLLTGAAGIIASACGSSEGDSIFGNGDAGADSPYSGQNNGDGALSFNDANLDPDAFYAVDPPVQWCGPPGGEPDAGPPPSGTAECPSDKNRQGCPCSNVGEVADCWPGLRKNRHVGICVDGKTTCVQNGEIGKLWGPCNGAVLPDPNAKGGRAACGCFSEGQWKIENLVPWFQSVSLNGGPKTWYAFSTYQDPNTGASTEPKNEYRADPSSGTLVPPTTPKEDWSKDTLKVDCAGKFKLSYTLKAGSFDNPLPTDCVVHRVDLPETEYPVAGVVQPWPNLPGWLDTGKSDCYVQFLEQGGYGEMSVQGESVTCDKIDDGSGNSFVFNRIRYCHQGDPNCGQDGSGVFH